MMRMHPIEPWLWVGSCPVAPEDSQILATAGIGAILCLQTDDDLKGLGIRWDNIWRCHVAAGLAVERVPIRDFDRRDLAAQVEVALAGLGRAREAASAVDKAVYLHCTAGLNRSTTIAIAALADAYDLSLEDATRRLLAKHPDAVPYVDTLGRWWKVRAREARRR